MSPAGTITIFVLLVFTVRGAAGRYTLRTLAEKHMKAKQIDHGAGQIDQKGKQIDQGAAQIDQEIEFEDVQLPPRPPVDDSLLNLENDYPKDLLIPLTVPEEVKSEDISVRQAEQNADVLPVRFRDARAATGSNIEALPDYMALTLEHSRRDVELPSSLDLVKNKKMSLMSFEVDGEPSPSNFEEVAFYQDRDKHAVITARSEQKQGKTVRTLRGSFVHDGTSYEIEPLVQDLDDAKRDVPIDGRSHVVRKMRGAPALFSPVMPQNEQIHRRSSTSFDVEMYWVADKALYDLWNKNYATGTQGLKEFFAHQANGVDLVYSSFTGITVNTWVLRVIIQTTAGGLPSDNSLLSTYNAAGRREIDKNLCLDKINDYIDKQGYTWNKPDHLMLYTGYALIGATVGYAPVSGICLPYRGKSVIEYSGWHTWAISAHELGHNLGMRHDGGNGCPDSTGNIMAPYVVKLSQVADVSKTFQFSSCSITDATNCLLGSDDDKYRRICLEDSACTQEGLVTVSTLPGQQYNLSVMCTDQIGSSSKGPGCGSEKYPEDICKVLWCSTGMQCTGARAADGTKCGSGKWCINGECVPNTQNPTVISKTCTPGTLPTIPPDCHDTHPQCPQVFEYPTANCAVFKTVCCKTCTTFGLG